MVWLGDVSYAFFLSHLVVTLNLHAAMRGEWGRARHLLAVLFLLGTLLSNVLPARLMYRLVEA